MKIPETNKSAAGKNGKPPKAIRYPTARPQKHEADFLEVVGMIQTAKVRAFQAANTVLTDLHWNVGAYISRKLESAQWGDGVVTQLAAYIASRHPDIRGFTRSNLFRMRQFHALYRADEKVAPLVRQLSWTQNLMIMSKCKRSEEREFYLQMAQREHWSKRVLEHQIDTCLFERQVLSPAKVSPVVTQLYPAAPQVFKDSYLLDFLDLPEPFDEHDLQKGLVRNLKRFLLELGRDFCFVGEQYRLQVGGKDFLLDLLFYHRELRCLVAFELKIDDFKPGYLGQLSFYLEALDRDVRKPHENPSVGVLLCKSKDREVVEYALNRTLSPALVAEYETKLPDRNLLLAKLHELLQIAETAEPYQVQSKPRKIRTAT
jgi:predicted nuclease of restriction endonuclease-like (RecB) superfamily